MNRMLALHFRVEGITYRDCNDAQQAAEHVVGITAAIAKQAYKVRASLPPLVLMHSTVWFALSSEIFLLSRVALMC